MPQKLEDLEISEVSIVDRPACSQTVDGKRIPRARVALFKRDSDGDDDLQKAVDGKTEDGVKFPKDDYAYTPDDVPSHWKLRLTSTPGGKPDARIVGAAVAALGPGGFRGNPVEIPASARAGVKAKVRAAWRAANPDKGSDELPDVLKINKGEGNMTIEQIEKKLSDQDVVLKALSDERNVLKAENELVLKMSKGERKAYAGMTEDERKAFLAADAEKRKGMLSKAKAARKEKALCDSMDDATKADFEKAGPNARAALLEAQKEKCKAAKAAKAKSGGKVKPGDSEDDDYLDDDEDTEKAKKSLLKKLDDVDSLVARVTKAETELETVRKRERSLRFAKRAEDELPHTPGTPEEKGDMIQKLAEAMGEGSEQFNKVMGQLREADKALSLHFTEVGAAGGTVPAAKAFDAKVEEIAKRDKIDTPHAVEKAMMEAPELYLDIERQTRRKAAQQ